MGGFAPTGRRARDATVNVVPFIDLLSCCIAFLLITAVWSQIGHLDVHRTGESHDPPDGPAPPVLTVGIDDFTLELDGSTDELPSLESLAIRLHGWNAANPHDTIQVRVVDGVTYATVVRALDIARDAGFTNLALSD